MLSASRRSMILAALLACGSALSGCGETRSAEPAASAKSAKSGALTVSVETPRLDQVTHRIAATGTVMAWEEAVVSAEIGGLRITDMLVSDGDRVAKDQVLARLDDRLLRAQIVQQQASIDEAAANLATAEAANARGQKLAATGAITKETAEERATTLLTDRAKLAQARAALDLLKVQLTQTEIRAPVAGLITGTPAVLGSMAQAGTELLRIVRDGRFEVAAAVPDGLLPSARPGQSADVTDAAGRAVAAKVRDVATKIDAATRLGTVHLALPADAGLRAGAFAHVVIHLDTAQAMTIPETALTWRDGQPGVLAVSDDGTVARRTVSTGERLDGRVQVTGLAGNERIVTAGAGFLNDGDTVRIATEQADVSEEASHE